MRLPLPKWWIWRNEGRGAMGLIGIPRIRVKLPLDLHLTNTDLPPLISDTRTPKKTGQFPGRVNPHGGSGHHPGSTNRATTQGEVVGRIHARFAIGDEERVDQGQVLIVKCSDQPRQIRLVHHKSGKSFLRLRESH